MAGHSVDGPTWSDLAEVGMFVADCRESARQLQVTASIVGIVCEIPPDYRSYEWFTLLSLQMAHFTTHFSLFPQICKKRSYLPQNSQF